MCVCVCLFWRGRASILRLFCVCEGCKYSFLFYLVTLCFSLPMSMNMIVRVLFFYSASNSTHTNNASMHSQHSSDPGKRYTYHSVSWTSRTQISAPPSSSHMR